MRRNILLPAFWEWRFSGIDSVLGLGESTENINYVNKSVDDRLLSLVSCEWHLERKGVQGNVNCPAPP